MKLDSFRKIAAALHDAEVRYLVAGGLAVVAHGYGRLTVDIDLFVQEPFAFNEGWDSALVEELDGGVAVRFVDIDRLIAMKRGTGRAKDLDDIQHLEELRDDDA